MICKNIHTKLNRLYSKLNNLNEDLKRGYNAEKYKLYGELITANIYKIKNNQDKLDSLIITMKIIAQLLFR